MGEGRTTVTFSGFNVKPKMVPGPGAYDLKNQCVPHIKGFNIKQRSTSLKKHWNNPGPGHYPYCPSINPQGKFTVSQYRNVTVPSIKLKMNSAKNAKE